MKTPKNSQPSKVKGFFSALTFILIVMAIPTFALIGIALLSESVLLSK